TAELVDPSGRVTPAGSLAEARSDHAATLLADGRVLVTGGSGVRDFLDTSEIFDPRAGTFSPGPTLPRAIAGQTTTLLSDGRGLLTGDEGSILFKPAPDGFVDGPLMTVSFRIGHTATMLADGSVVLVGGHDPVEVFHDPRVTFVQGKSLPAARTGHTAT